MQNGSLVECINGTGWGKITDQSCPLMGPQKGEIGKVVDMGRSYGIAWIELAEYPPINGKRSLWEQSKFVEIQPPMEINISELISEPVMV